MRLLDRYSTSLNTMPDARKTHIKETDTQLQIDIDQLNEAIEMWKKFNNEHSE